jgi:hypothetical protein
MNSYLVIQVYFNRIVWEIFGYGLYNIMVFCQHRSEFVIFLSDRIMATMFLVSYLFSFRRLGLERWRYSKYLKASFSFHQLRFEEQKFYKMIFEEWKIILCRLCMNVNGGIIPSRSFHIYDKWYFGFYDIFSLY